jgi:hypothetical protein
MRHADRRLLVDKPHDKQPECHPPKRRLGDSGTEHVGDFMTDLSLEKLVSLLKAKGYEANIQKETGQVYAIFKEDDQEFPLFGRIYETGELLQLIAFFPYQLENKVLSDIARLLHLLNKELDIPGFGMDEFGGVSFFRCMLNTPGKKIDEKQLELYLNTIRLACKSFNPTIAAVATGAMSVDDIIDKAQNAVKEMKK